MEQMPLLNPRCCGMDVHKETVVACVRILDQQGRVRDEVRSFTTNTRGILELGDWLAEQNIPIAAMDLR